MQSSIKPKKPYGRAKCEIFNYGRSSVMFAVSWSDQGGFTPAGRQILRCIEEGQAAYRAAQPATDQEVVQVVSQIERTEPDCKCTTVFSRQNAHYHGTDLAERYRYMMALEPTALMREEFSAFKYGYALYGNYDAVDGRGCYNTEWYVC